MVNARDNAAIVDGVVVAAMPDAGSYEIRIEQTTNIDGLANMMRDRVGDIVVVHVDERTPLAPLTVTERCRLRVKVLGPGRFAARPVGPGDVVDAAAGSPPPAGPLATFVLPADDHRPVLLLEVDGVLQPTGETLPSGFRAEEVGSRTIRFSSTHRSWLRELAEHYQLVWATSWGNTANEVLASRYWLEELPVLDLAAYDSDAAILDAVARSVGDREIVWITATPPDGTGDWLASRQVPGQLIQPDPALGLTKPEYDQLDH